MNAISYIKSKDGDLESLLLAAALPALGVQFDERASSNVKGDVVPCVNWLFESKSASLAHNHSMNVKLAGGVFALARTARSW